MKKSTLAIFTALIGGAAIGSFLGVLYAPDKGINTRERLNFRLYKTRDRLRALLDELVDNKEIPTTSAQEEGQRVISDVREKAENLLTDVEKLIEQIRQK
ncbi:YtxH domain-containing protein [Hugenholtzia roseola]|uniref:YtxH domain-containing protein n=1 Tax=Hugenholtzia roseola TaxID=1002 RepID=UPI000425CDD3|nr:YtxH domain-containing protein [Hugenholtzia roseola]